MNARVLVDVGIKSVCIWMHGIRHCTLNFAHVCYLFETTYLYHFLIVWIVCISFRPEKRESFIVYIVCISFRPPRLHRV